MSDGCGAPADTPMVTSAGNQAVVQGTVTKDGTPVSPGYARLLNSGGDFVAEVPLGTDGGFQFFAAPGDWTLRVLAPGGIRAERPVSAAIGEISKLEVAV
ncbi:MAG TPA: DUF1416 domain-containing protein [Streptosporangiaceae bacterium]|jgi:hypothetical protein|nr:DUF1416 domain-containing protein [Streptosporangiaceae bacterium]